MTDRLAVIDPVTPTISVIVYGTSYPALPVDQRSISNTYCPQWGAGTVNPSVFVPYNDENSFSVRSNQPAFYAAGYSTGGLSNDYIGLKLYALFGGNSAFTGGAQISAETLVQPTSIIPFVGGPGYRYDMVIPTLASTLANPEAMLFITESDGSGGIGGLKWGGLKLNLAGETELVGLFIDEGGDKCKYLYAALGAGSSYYILRSDGPGDYVGLASAGNSTYAFTICTEQIYPATDYVNYTPGFVHADLPTYLSTLANWIVQDPLTATYIPVAIHPTDLGFVISFKKKITGTWYSKYILVAKDWTTFQWIEFTAGNAAATTLLAQGTGNPFNIDDALEGTKAISAFYANGHWYLLGGTMDVPVVARDVDEAEDYAILTLGTATDGTEGFFDEGWGPGENAIIDGAFFGFIDSVTPIDTGLFNNCERIAFVAQPLGNINTENLVGIILRCDDGIWRVTAVSEDNTRMTLHRYEEPKRVIHETSPSDG